MIWIYKKNIWLQALNLQSEYSNIFLNFLLHCFHDLCVCCVVQIDDRTLRQSSPADLVIFCIWCIVRKNSVWSCDFFCDVCLQASCSTQCWRFVRCLLVVSSTTVTCLLCTWCKSLSFRCLFNIWSLRLEHAVWSLVNDVKRIFEKSLHVCNICRKHTQIAWQLLFAVDWKRNFNHTKSHHRLKTCLYFTRITSNELLILYLLPKEAGILFNQVKEVWHAVNLLFTWSCRSVTLLFQSSVLNLSAFTTGSVSIRQQEGFTQQASIQCASAFMHRVITWSLFTWMMWSDKLIRSFTSSRCSHLLCVSWSPCQWCWCFNRIMKRFWLPLLCCIPWQKQNKSRKLLSIIFRRSSSSCNSIDSFFADQKRCDRKSEQCVNHSRNRFFGHNQEDIYSRHNCCSNKLSDQKTFFLFLLHSLCKKY